MPPRSTSNHVHELTDAQLEVVAGGGIGDAWEWFQKQIQPADPKDDRYWFERAWDRVLGKPAPRQKS